MTTIIERAEQVTAEWLTSVLRERGALPRGGVAGVAPGEAQASFASAVWRLAVSYTADAPPGAPERLFLKVSSPALAPGSFDPQQLKREVDFYQVIAAEMARAGAMDRAGAAPFVIPCYDAAYDPTSGAGHILLKDVSETHESCLEPENAHAGALAVDALAGLHAFWWDHPRLGQDVGAFPSAEERRQSEMGTAKNTRAFVAALGDRLLPGWGQAYERVLAALPNLFRRHDTGRNLTLVHGDAHLGNFLFPRAGEGAAYLLDWQFWHPTIGGTDLAFLMATGWAVETRRRLEEPLLRRYYQGLLAGGVQGYPWEACWDDYRLSVILVGIFIPVWQWALFGWEVNLPGLRASMTAFDDLKCEELLK